MRYSKQREEILKVLKGSSCHPNADWVYEKVRREIPNISLGTVYRNLNQLIKVGEIVAIKDGPVMRYDGNTQKHDHFKCSVCGFWYDMDILDEDFLRSMHSSNEFVVHDFNLELTGTCKKCMENQGE